MKYIALISLFTLAQNLSAMTVKENCPKILKASGLLTDAVADSLQDQFKAMNDDGSFNFETAPEIQTYSINRGNDSLKYKITVEEIKPASSSGTPPKKFDLTCPIVKNWNASTLPDVRVSKPSIVIDVADKENSVARGGVELVKLFPGHDDFFTAKLYWRVSAKDLKVDLPLLLTDSNTKYYRNSLDQDETLPVKGVRISTTGKFGNIWYLLGQKTKERLLAGQHEFLNHDENGYGPSEDRYKLSEQTSTLDGLDFYDSVNKNFLPCEQALNTFVDNSCFNFNYQLNPDLWNTMKKGKAFYVQLLIELKIGYLFQTYKVGEAANGDPLLIKQSYTDDISKYNLQPNLF